MFSSVSSWLYFFIAAVLAALLHRLPARVLPRALGLSAVNVFMLTLLFLNDKKHLLLIFCFVLANTGLVFLLLRASAARYWVLAAQTIGVLVFLCTFRYEFARHLATVFLPTRAV